MFTSKYTVIIGTKKLREGEKYKTNTNLNVCLYS